jgi:hypothetical protein
MQTAHCFKFDKIIAQNLTDFNLTAVNQNLKPPTALNLTPLLPKMKSNLTP